MSRRPSRIPYAERDQPFLSSLAAGAAGAAAGAAGVDPWSLVLGGGEDHALVACFPDYPPHGWRVIGSVLPGPPGVLLDGRPWTGPAGWQSYE